MIGLPPTLRKKKRYIAFRVHSDEAVKRGDVVRSIWYNVLGFLGERTSADLDLWVKDFDDQQGFLVCRHTKVGDVIACLTLVDEIGHRKASIEVLGVSGTLKALKKKFLNTFIEVNEMNKKIEFQEKEMRVVKSHNGCLDAVTYDEELNGRLKNLKMDYIGLTEEDLP
ncbi:MAG: Rpp14/Pop5 family protein [Candidatus Hydrothermarchaeales archaeon]